MLCDGGALRPEIENIEGVRVLSLGKKGRWDLLPFLLRLSRVVRETRPDILHGYMGIANELCSLMARLHGGRAVWGLRQSERDPFQYGWLTRWSERAGAWVSRFADLIIANSHAGKRYYAGLGYRADRMIVVHNGVDTARFHPDRAAGRSIVGVVGQRLVRRICQSCIAPYQPTPSEMLFYQQLGGIPKPRWIHGDGCNVCAGTGYRDRIGVYEVLAVTDEVRQMLITGASPRELRDLVVRQGMQPLRTQALRLVSDDVTTIAEIIRTVYVV